MHPRDRYGGDMCWVRSEGSMNKQGSERAHVEVGPTKAGTRRRRVDLIICIYLARAQRMIVSPLSAFASFSSDYWLGSAGWNPHGVGSTAARPSPQHRSLLSSSPAVSRTPGGGINPTNPRVSDFHALKTLVEVSLSLGGSCDARSDDHGAAASRSPSVIFIGMRGVGKVR
jgi:hypothetical protein